MLPFFSVLLHFLKKKELETFFREHYYNKKQTRKKKKKKPFEKWIKMAFLKFPLSILMVFFNSISYQFIFFQSYWFIFSFHLLRRRLAWLVGQKEIRKKRSKMNLKIINALTRGTKRCSASAWKKKKWDVTKKKIEKASTTWVGLKKYGQKKNNKQSSQGLGGGARGEEIKEKEKKEDETDCHVHTWKDVARSIASIWKKWSEKGKREDS